MGFQGLCWYISLWFLYLLVVCSIYGASKELKEFSCDIVLYFIRSIIWDEVLNFLFVLFLVNYQ